MKQKKVCIERDLDPEQVAGFLRALADELDGSCQSCLGNYGIDLQDFSKIKVGLRKGETGELSLKIKVKELVDKTIVKQNEKKICTPKNNDEMTLHHYKHLKKRMKGTFALLSKAIANDGEIQQELVRSFVEDSREMTTYHGFGDEFYPEFNELCEGFEKAFKKQDSQRLGDVFQALCSRKRACHAKYK